MYRQPIFIDGRHYVVFPDGAFTMPMQKALARAYVKVFGGTIKTVNPTIIDRWKSNIALLAAYGLDHFGMMLRMLIGTIIAPLVVSQYWIPLLYNIFAR